MELNKLRTKSMWSNYHTWQQKPAKDQVFTYGSLVERYWFGDVHINPFPYDEVAQDHHTLWLCKPYWITYWLLMPYYIWKFRSYDSVVINLKSKSVSDKAHIHLINWKTHRKYEKVNR